jgi:cytochrome c peroxidase
VLNAPTSCVIHWAGDRTGLEGQVFQAVTSPITARRRNIAKRARYVQDGLVAALLEAVRVMARVHPTSEMPADFASVPMLAAGTVLPAK